MDDDRFFAQEFIEELRSEFTVLFHNTSEDAIRSIVEDESLDAAILDVMMDPPLIAPLSEVKQGFSTGVWIFKKIRDHAISRRLPICLLTNRDPGTVLEEIAGLLSPRELFRVQSKEIEPEKLRLLLGEMIEASHRIPPLKEG